MVLRDMSPVYSVMATVGYQGGGLALSWMRRCRLHLTPFRHRRTYLSMERLYF